MSAAQTCSALFGIAIDEAVEHRSKLRHDERRHVLEAAHQRALGIVAAHGDDPLADILRQVSDPFEVIGNPQHRHQRAQIDRHRLPQCDRCDRFVLDLPLQRVDRRVGGNDLTRQPDIAAGERVDRVCNLLLSKATHLRNQLGELDEVGVEDSGGVLGNVHVIVCRRWRLYGVRATLLLGSKPRIQI